MTRLYAAPRGSLLICQELMAGDARVAAADVEKGSGAGSAEQKPDAPKVAGSAARIRTASASNVGVEMVQA